MLEHKQNIDKRQTSKVVSMQPWMYTCIKTEEYVWGMEQSANCAAAMDVLTKPQKEDYALDE